MQIIPSSSDKNRIIPPPSVNSKLYEIKWIFFCSQAFRRPTAVSSPFSDTSRTCCPWSHGLRPKKLSDSVAVPSSPVRVPSQRPLAPSVRSVTSVANDKGDNEMILGAVHRSPGICLTAEENHTGPFSPIYLCILLYLH